MAVIPGMGWRGACGEASFFLLEHDPEEWKPVFRKDRAQKEKKAWRKS
jgi:hypothetical protein